MEELFFFDSWGRLHVTCSGDHPEAAAFGPLGISRPADPREAGLELRPEETAFAAALRSGRLCRAKNELDWNILEDSDF